MYPYLDLTNKKFGRLLVLERTPRKPRAWWKCQCDCGKIVEVASRSLTAGCTNSCGCLMLDKAKERSTKHGHAPTPGKPASRTYNSWRGMNCRCTNPKQYGYSEYGGRGIKVCERWRHSFENFLADMGERPIGMEIDRIDTNGDYCKDNCRWVTDSQNNRNRRNNVIIEFKGESRCLTEWS